VNETISPNTTIAQYTIISKIGEGRFLLYWKRGEKTRWDVWLHPMTGGASEIPLLSSPADEVDALISPNGKWVGYVSDETGEDELYVQSFKEDGTLGTDRKRISIDGGWTEF
jgi:Tol biopolymer transport system component